MMNFEEVLGVKWEQIFQANNVHIWLKNENAKESLNDYDKFNAVLKYQGKKMMSLK